MKLLARVAENLYWLGRYLERADNTSRLVDVTRLTAIEKVAVPDPWRTVLATLGAQEAFAAARAAQEDLTAESFVLDAPQSNVSILVAVRRARMLATELREHISREVFEEINRLYLDLSVAPAPLPGRTASTRELRRSVAAVFGLFGNTVLQTEGTHWFRLGQMLERADMTSRIVDAKYFILLPSPRDVGGTVDRYQWRGILMSASALGAYRKRFKKPIRLDLVLDLLFFDPAFPRSLVFCINEMTDLFSVATSSAHPNETLDAEREMTLTALELRALNGQIVVKRGVHSFIDRFQARLGQIHAALSGKLFNTRPSGLELNAPLVGLPRTVSFQGPHTETYAYAGDQ